MQQPSSRKFRFALWLRRLSTRMILEEFKQPPTDLPVIQSRPAKDILLYVVTWRPKGSENRHVMFGPNRERGPYEQKHTDIPSAVWKDSCAGSWGGDVRDPHSTLRADVVSCGPQSSTIRLGDHFMTISNVDLLNAITRPEQHEEVFGDAHPFAYTDKRDYMRDANFYYGSCFMSDMVRKQKAALWQAKQEALA